MADRVPTCSNCNVGMDTTNAYAVVAPEPTTPTFWICRRCWSESGLRIVVAYA